MHGWMWVSGLALLGGLAQAQPPTAGNAAPSAELTPAERAQRDADKVFKWIRIQADKPVQRAMNPAPPVAAKSAAPAVAAKSGRPRTAEPTAQAAAPAPAVTTAQQQQTLKSEPAAISATEPSLLAAARIAAPPPVAIAAPEPEPEPERPLKALAMVEPEMPRQLPASIRKGVVLVRFTVQPDGTVHQAEIVQSTHQRLSDSALEAVSKWRFEPIAQARVATVEVGFSRE